MRVFLVLTFFIIIRGANYSFAQTGYVDFQTIKDGLETIDEVNTEGYDALKYFSHGEVKKCIEALNYDRQIRIGSSCEEIAVGENLNVNVSQDQSPTNVRMKYTLQRDNEKDYRVGINPFFYEADENFIVWEKFTSTPQLRTNMKIIMDRCFTKFGKLRLPDGRSISFHFDPKAPKVAIGNNVHDSNHRTHSLEYKDGISCSLILHEVLHLLGLVDEYDEHIKDYPYRVISSSENIMNQHTQALTVSHGFYTFSKCQRRALVDSNGNEVIINTEILKRVNQVKVKNRSREPSHLRNKRQREAYLAQASELEKREYLEEYEKLQTGNYECVEYNGPDEFTLNMVDYDYEVGDQYKSKNYYVKEKVPGKGEVTLREDQLNSILFPLCEERNSKYYTCSKFAYILKGKTQEKVPEYCQEMFNPDD